MHNICTYIYVYYYEQTGARVLRMELKERCIRWV